MKSLAAKLSTLFLILLLAGTVLAADTTTKFKVTGMYCDACQTKIEKALSKTDGVKSATIDWKAGSASVTFDDAKVNPEQIIKVIEKQGYKAEPEKK
ncbi:MAG: heavy-metal-associated domain-containing protein [Terriglobales bacterium]